jgi:hypothetical protein
MGYFRKVVNMYRRCLPEYTFSVRRVRVPQNCHGDCLKLKDGTFRIRISKDLYEELALETLIHEMAHVLAWDKPGNYTHGAAWGQAYSKCYRIFLREMIYEPNNP